MAYNALPTKAKLRDKNVHIQMKYNFCPNNFEDASHVFTKCPYTVKNLHKINLKTANILCNLSTTNGNMLSILKEINGKINKKEIEELFLFWWCL